MGAAAGPGGRRLGVRRPGDATPCVRDHGHACLLLTTAGGRCASWRGELLLPPWRRR